MKGLQFVGLVVPVLHIWLCVYELYSLFLSIIHVTYNCDEPWDMYVSVTVLVDWYLLLALFFFFLHDF